MDSLLNNPDIDVISICTPEPYHVEPCSLAAEAGKNILLEKPIAMTLEDADKIIRAAQTHNVKLMVGHILRFDPRYCYAKEAVERGDVGDIASMWARRFDTYIQQIKRKGRVSLMFFLGVHDLDIIRWISNSNVKTIYSQAVHKVYKRENLEVEDAIYSILKFENDMIAIVEEGSILPDNYPSQMDAKSRVLGTKGLIDIDYDKVGISINNGQMISDPDIIYTPEYSGAMRGALRTQIEHFIDSAVHDKEPKVSNEDAREAVKIAIAGIESSKTGKVVTVN